MKNIVIMHEKGMESLVPHVAEAVDDILACFPNYHHQFQIKNLGNWMSKDAHVYQNGNFLLRPYESVEWYLAKSQEVSINQGRWQRGKQLNASRLMSDLLKDPYSKNEWRIFMTYHDLYGQDNDGNLLNFCFGLSSPNALSVVSSHRFMNENNHLKLENFKTLIQHEFGHVLGLTVPGRINTYEQLGIHCQNTACVMRQRMFGDLSDATEIRLTRKRAGLLPICPDCIRQGEQNLSVLQRIYSRGSRE